jgi:hypothetical protein
MVLPASRLQLEVPANQPKLGLKPASTHWIGWQPTHLLAQTQAGAVPLQTCVNVCSPPLPNSLLKAEPSQPPRPHTADYTQEHTAANIHAAQATAVHG